MVQVKSRNAAPHHNDRGNVTLLFCTSLQSPHRAPRAATEMMEIEHYSSSHRD
jgi:hypothetical protein